MKISKLVTQLMGGSLLIIVGISKALSCSNELAGYLDKVSYYCVPIAQCVSPSSCAENNFTGNYQACTQTYEVLNAFLKEKNPSAFSSLKKPYNSVTFWLNMVYKNYQAGKTFSTTTASQVKNDLPYSVETYNTIILDLKSAFCPK